MANPNYVLLERVVVGANGTTTVTFNNIPQSGYTDLKIVTKKKHGSICGLRFASVLSHL